jgi:hypothetical protein
MSIKAISHRQDKQSWWINEGDSIKWVSICFQLANDRLIQHPATVSRGLAGGEPYFADFAAFRDGESLKRKLKDMYSGCRSLWYYKRRPAFWYVKLCQIHGEANV